MSTMDKNRCQDVDFCDSNVLQTSLKGKAFYAVHAPFCEMLSL